MRTLVIIGLLVIALGLSAFFTIPLAFAFVTEYAIEQECNLPSPTPACVSRMRAMGNIWSSRHDYARAEPWYRRSAASGDPVAMFELGWLYQVRTLHDHPKANRKTQAYRDDMENAFSWTLKAAQAGFPPAMNNLGQMYWNGFQPNANLESVTLPDYREAFKWHLAAARAHNPVAVWNVAFAYSQGRGPSQDPFAAARWAAWKPYGRHEGDLDVPILERTGFAGRALTAVELATIRYSVVENDSAPTMFAPTLPPTDCRCFPYR